MGEFTDFGIEIEKHLTKLGKDIQEFVEKVVPLNHEDKDFAPDCDILESSSEYKVQIDLPLFSYLYTLIPAFVFFFKCQYI